MKNCHNKQYERQFVNMMTSQGIFCMRIAGSGAGKEACCDCIMIKNGITHLVEVKATREKTFYIRQGIKEQLEKMIHIAKENNCVPILAIKFKHKGWKIIDLNCKDILLNSITTSLSHD